MATHLLSLREMMYLDRFHGTAEWNTKHADTIVEMTLNIMETFERYCSSFSSCACTLTYPLPREKKTIEKVEQRWNPTLQVLSGEVAEDSLACCAARRVTAKVCTFLLPDSFLQAVHWLVSACFCRLQIRLRKCQWKGPPRRNSRPVSTSYRSVRLWMPVCRGQ